MNATVYPPTPEIMLATTLLDEALARLIQEKSTCHPDGKFESDVEALNLLHLIIRHIESVTVLATRDLVTLPSAMTVARAAFETTIKLLWLIDPDDPFDREVRWLAQLQTEEEYYKNVAARLATLGKGQAEQRIATTIAEFRLGVIDRLPKGYVPDQHQIPVPGVMKASG
jgi:hypothetical protein